MRNEKVQKLTLTALMAALSYVIFTFLQIKVTLPGGSATSFHLGNAVVVLAALLLGGVYGGIGGAIGMTIGDLLDPIYITGAPKTFFLKLMIGVITGLVAHKLGKITYSTDKKHVFKWTVLAACAGMLFNFIFDPIISYFYDMLILGKPMAQLKNRMERDHNRSQCSDICDCCDNRVYGTETGAHQGKSVFQDWQRKIIVT